MFKEGDENISFDYRRMLRTNKNVYLLNVEDYKSRAPTGSDYLSQKKCPYISAYYIKRSNLCSFNCYSKEQHFATKDTCSLFILVTRYALLP